MLSGPNIVVQLEACVGFMVGVGKKTSKGSNPVHTSTCTLDNDSSLHIMSCLAHMSKFLTAHLVTCCPNLNILPCVDLTKFFVDCDGLGNTEILPTNICGDNEEVKSPATRCREPKGSKKST